MSIPRKINSSEKKESVAKAKDGFIRTVRLDLADAAGTFDKTKPLEKRSTPKQKEEFKDIVRGVNINPYISSSLDISPDLFAPLDNIEQKYAVLEEFAQGGFGTISIARDKNLERLVAVKKLNIRKRRK